MPVELVTGNRAAGIALARAGEANRGARGAACGIYPITPQTEIVEYVAGFPFSRGRVVPAESEHSAMGVTMGASVAGARAFTASSSNGLAYMVENVIVTGLYRLPVVMVAVNRTLGPPWNIWVDHGDTLMLRDFPWIQMYCEDHQEVVDTVLLAFRLGEDPRILLPVLVCMDAFIVSHTQSETDLPDQEAVDAFLPELDLPHRLRAHEPRTLGGLAWPAQSMSMRKEIHEAMGRVPAVLAEGAEAFRAAFGREPGGPVQAEATDDAETVLVTMGTLSTTAREVVRARRDRGERVGLVKLKMVRPFPAARLRSVLAGATRVGVLDRNYGAGSGGIVQQELRGALQGTGEVLVQGYLTGLCGGDVRPAHVEEILDDLARRPAAGEPVWVGLEESSGPPAGAGDPPSPAEVREGRRAVGSGMKSGRES
jgi:pyruvate/2-oxoacid:ferredoxin oxidoreductase alpha subunit